MSKRPRFTEEEYDKIKLLQHAKVGMKNTLKITGRSYSTISRVYRSDNFEEYRNLFIENRPHAANPADESEDSISSEDFPVVVKDASGVSEEKLEVLLERIAVAAERMADAWESQPTKKRFF